MKMYKSIIWALALAGLVLVGFIYLQYPGRAADMCPKTVPAQEVSISSSLYYMKSGETPGLWVYDGNSNYRLDLEITPWSTFVIAPNGERLLHLSIPPAGSVAADQDTGFLSLIELPILATESAAVQEISIKKAWSAIRSRAIWIDDERISFDVADNHSIVVDVADNSVQEIIWPQLADYWQNSVWGFSSRSLSLNYFVYPSGKLEEGIPNPRSGEALLRLISMSDPTVSYVLIPGYIGSIRWQQGAEIFVFQGLDNKWYRLDAEEIIQGDPNLFTGRSLSVFHDGVGAHLDHPSLSPDSHHLATVLYLPDKQTNTLLILSDNNVSPTDICLHGQYDFQMLYSQPVSGIWSSESRYIAFVVSTQARRSLYVYDTLNKVIAQIDGTDSSDPLVLVGWGN